MNKKLCGYGSLLFAGLAITLYMMGTSALAQEKVLVVPLGGNVSDPNLLPQNISYGVTIFGVTGTLGPPTVTSAGQIWMDRNLGAYQVATSSTDSLAYGDLYQWGRLSDHHEYRTSSTTSIVSSTNVPGHGSFIIGSADWGNPQNDNLWQEVSGVNNPCPTGFRLPTDTEWETERASWSSDDRAGAFASPLKLVTAGFRDYTNGTVSNTGSHGLYWSSMVHGSSARYLGFSIVNADIVSTDRAIGLSVRCIKD